MFEYIIIVEKAGKNFSAYCPDLPGCIATGATSEETIKNMKEAIKFHLEGLKEENLPLPESSTKAVSVEIAINS